ncbi:YphA family membrane protein [Peribacillus kribbensis]|uniref:YphA family membrane protein n=1 Tax=Peribacillus kribbensis TaxID=356658 RepID=UPI0004110011|nr:hypothetical protein [Peribacillus kribbensis]
MDGLLFYWISWIGVVVTLFLLNKSFTDRRFILFGLLGAIIVSPYSLRIGQAEANPCGLWLALISVWMIRTLPSLSLLTFIIRTLVVSFAYGSISLLFFLDPVWIIWNKTWMLGLFLTYIILLLFADWKKRVSSLILGLFFGDIMVNVLFGSLNMPQDWFAKTWLDLTYLSGLLIFAWGSLEKGIRILQTFFQQKNIPKEKQG